MDNDTISFDELFAALGTTPAAPSSISSSSLEGSASRSKTKKKGKKRSKSAPANAAPSLPQNPDEFSENELFAALGLAEAPSAPRVTLERPAPRYDSERQRARAAQREEQRIRAQQWKKELQQQIAKRSGKEVEAEKADEIPAEPAVGAYQEILDRFGVPERPQAKKKPVASPESVTALQGAVYETPKAKLDAPSLSLPVLIEEGSASETSAPKRAAERSRSKKVRGEDAIAEPSFLSRSLEEEGEETTSSVKKSKETPDQRAAIHESISEAPHKGDEASREKASVQEHASSPRIQDISPAKGDVPETSVEEVECPSRSVDAESWKQWQADQSRQFRPREFTEVGCSPSERGTTVQHQGGVAQPLSPSAVRPWPPQQQHPASSSSPEGARSAAPSSQFPGQGGPVGPAGQPLKGEEPQGAQGATQFQAFPAVPVRPVQVEDQVSYWNDLKKQQPSQASIAAASTVRSGVVVEGAESDGAAPVLPSTPISVQYPPPLGARPALSGTPGDAQSATSGTPLSGQDQPVEGAAMPAAQPNAPVPGSTGPLPYFPGSQGSLSAQPFAGQGPSPHPGAYHSGQMPPTPFPAQPMQQVRPFGGMDAAPKIANLADGIEASKHVAAAYEGSHPAGETKPAPSPEEVDAPVPELSSETEVQAVAATVIEEGAPSPAPPIEVAPLETSAVPPRSAKPVDIFAPPSGEKVCDGIPPEQTQPAPRPTGPLSDMPPVRMQEPMSLEGQPSGVMPPVSLEPSDLTSGQPQFRKPVQRQPLTPTTRTPQQAQASFMPATQSLAIVKRPEEVKVSKKDNIFKDSPLGIALIVVAVLCALVAVALLTGIIDLKEFGIGGTKTETTASTSSSTPQPGPLQSIDEGADEGSDAAVYSYIVRSTDGTTHRATETARFNEDGKLSQSVIEIEVANEEEAQRLVDQLSSDFEGSVLDSSATADKASVTLGISRDDLTKEAYTELLSTTMMDFKVIAS